MSYVFIIPYLIEFEYFYRVMLSYGIFQLGYIIIVPIVLIILPSRQMKYINKLCKNIPLEHEISLENETGPNLSMLKKSKQSMKLFILLLSNFLICLCLMGFFILFRFIWWTPFFIVLLSGSYSSVNAVIILFFYLRYRKILFEKFRIKYFKIKSESGSQVSLAHRNKNDEPVSVTW